jgi:ribosomal-protein-alanine N-acetyltransferase
LVGEVGSLLLQPLGPLDLAVAAALHAGCFDSPWNEAAIAELLAMPGSFGTIAQIEHEPAGLVIALAVGMEAEILTLAVLPTFRRRGVARRLLASVVDRLAGAGCQRLLLEVAEDNAAARSLYGTLGFAEIGHRPSYYRDSAGAATAAIVLARALDRRET